jgi:probable rRNA maturation factor
VSAAPTPAAIAGVEIEISRDPSVRPPSGVDVRRCIEAALDAAGCNAASLGLRWVGADESAVLNTRYRGKTGPTNVLAFASPCLPGLPVGQTGYLGDIVICVPVLEAEAIEQGKTLQSHTTHLLIHGCLHLAGYEHEGAADAERMERLEIEIMAGLGYEDPYRKRAGWVADE